MLFLFLFTNSNAFEEYPHDLSSIDHVGLYSQMYDVEGPMVTSDLYIAESLLALISETSIIHPHVLDFVYTTLNNQTAICCRKW
jgi:hypothetical protein